MLHLIVKTDDGRRAAIPLDYHFMAAYEKFEAEVDHDEEDGIDGEPDERWFGKAKLGSALDVDPQTLKRFEATIADDSADPDYGYLTEGLADANGEADIYMTWDGQWMSLELRGGGEAYVAMRWAKELESLRQLRRRGYAPLSGENRAVLQRMAHRVGGRSVWGMDCDWHSLTRWVPLSVFMYFRLNRALGRDPEKLEGEFSLEAVRALILEYLASDARRASLDDFCWEYFGEIDIANHDAYREVAIDCRTPPGDLEDAWESDDGGMNGMTN